MIVGHKVCTVNIKCVCNHMWLCYNCSFKFSLLEAGDKMMDVIGPSPKKYVLGASKIPLIKFFQKCYLYVRIS